MRTITVQTKNDLFAEALINFLKSIDENAVITDKPTRANRQEKYIPFIDIDPEAKPEQLFGIWKNRNVTLENLRNFAWGGRQ